MKLQSWGGEREENKNIEIYFKILLLRLKHHWQFKHVENLFLHILLLSTNHYGTAFLELKFWKRALRIWYNTLVSMLLTKFLCFYWIAGMLHRRLHFSVICLSESHVHNFREQMNQDFWNCNELKAESSKISATIFGLSGTYKAKPNSLPTAPAFPLHWATGTFSIDAILTFSRGRVTIPFHSSIALFFLLRGFFCVYCELFWGREPF